MYKSYFNVFYTMSKCQIRYNHRRGNAKTTLAVKRISAASPQRCGYFRWMDCSGGAVQRWCHQYPFEMLKNYIHADS